MQLSPPRSRGSNEPPRVFVEVASEGKISALTFEVVVGANEEYRARVLVPRDLPFYGVGPTQISAIRDALIAMRTSHDHLAKNEHLLGVRMATTLAMLRGIFEQERVDSREQGVTVESTRAPVLYGGWSSSVSPAARMR